MGHLYPDWDAGLFDYQPWSLGGLRLRGPAPRGANPIVFLGAAQTYGRFCADPFPSILCRALGREAINLGVGGKGPGFFLDSPVVRDALERAPLVVVQVPSGRSVGNSAFQPTSGGRDGVRLADGVALPAESFYEDLLGRPGGREAVERLIAETRRRYVDEMVALLDGIAAPTVLLWLSVRAPDRRFADGFGPHASLQRLRRAAASLGMGPRLESVAGEFPHFVDEATLAAIEPHADASVRCVGAAGLPRIVLGLRARRVAWNDYYPSPAMHRLAADRLLEPCRRLLARGATTAPDHPVMRDVERRRALVPTSTHGVTTP